MARRSGLLPPAMSGFEHIRRFWQPEYQSFVAKILPGEYYVTRGGELIGTVLGSCVSACVRDPSVRMGGMNHFLLPEDAGGGWSDSGVGLAHRYGSYAMEHLINDLLKHGADRSRLEIKLVGGGRMMERMSDVGARNIDFVRHYLQREGFRLAGEDLGGNHPRRVFYDVVTGRVRVKKLPARVGENIVNEELGYRRGLESRKVAGDVELF